MDRKGQGYRFTPYLQYLHMPCSQELYLEKNSILHHTSSFSTLGAPRQSPAWSPLLASTSGSQSETYLTRNSSTFSSTCNRLASSCPRSWLTLRSSS